MSNVKGIIENGITNISWHVNFHMRRHSALNQRSVLSFKIINRINRVLDTPITPHVNLAVGRGVQTKRVRVRKVRSSE